MPVRKIPTVRQSMRPKKAAHEECRASSRCAQVDQRCASRRLFPMVGGDEHKRAQRHRLPRDKECQHICGEYDECHAEQKDRHAEVEDAHVDALSNMVHIRGNVSGDGHADESDDAEKPGAQTIQPQVNAGDPKEQRGWKGELERDGCRG